MHLDLWRLWIMKFSINGTRRGLGQALEKKYGNVDLEDCDVFINCKHETQLDMLYKAADMGKRIINIGSHASDYTYRNRYSVEKKALREANHQLYSARINTTIINFGYFDTPRAAHYHGEKMDLNYCINLIEWILEQPYRVKEITVAA